MSKPRTITAASAAALCLGLTFGACTPKKDTTPPGTACTEEAKICEDGSSVSREGADCEFAACPDVTEATPVDDADEPAEPADAEADEEAEAG